MTRITVGVPVYNGGDQLRECLECLLAQTMTNIEIRIYDNASIDATPDIAREFEARDSRIRHIRHPENIRAMPNFHRIIQECETPLMMWRAHDDLCSPDYIDRLNKALAANPAASLAAATTDTLYSDRIRTSRPKPLANRMALADIIRLMFNSHPGWLYGLWKRDALLKEFETASAAYPHPWALDHLILFPFLLDRAVAFAPETTFIQRVVTKTYTPKKGTKPPVAEMLALRRQFSTQCRSYIAERPFSTAERLVLRAVLPFYVDKRVYRLRKALKRTLLRDKTPPAVIEEF